MIEQPDQGGTMPAAQAEPVSTDGGEQAKFNPGRTYYEDFFSKVLDGALERKGSLEQRGITVVTTSATLVTLIFTIVSFVLAHVGSSGINPHSFIKGSIDLAVILLVAAAVFGLAINLPVPYGTPDPRDLAGFLFDEDATEKPLKGSPASSTTTSIEEEEITSPPTRSRGEERYTREQEIESRSKSRFLTDNADAAAWEVALARVKLLRRAKRWNQLKARLLFLAVLCEVVAIGSLAWGIHKLLGL
jgi:hypothetical protein